MYLDFYKMKKAPFNVTPDPEFLFLSQSHKEALAAVIYGVDQKKGFIEIIGEVGVGKTTIIRSYLDKVDREQLKLIYLFNANITFVGLLKSVLRELGLNCSSDAPVDMVTRLHEYLISEYKNGRTVVLIIDEAQNMPIETLENLRMLSNLETTEDKLIQIVFSAQPEFDELLSSRELRQLKQRIAVKATILPLNSDESMQYIRHRLSKVTLGADVVVFSESAMRLIVRKAKGIPRVVNMLCDNSLITSYGYNLKRVNRRVVREIVTDLGFQGIKTFSVARIIGVSLIGILVLAGTYVALEALPFRLPKDVGLVSEIPAKIVSTGQATNRTVAVAGDSVPAVKPADISATNSRLVKKGDTMVGLIIDTYGYVDKSLIDLVKRNNPGVKDANQIVVGERINFPIASR